MVKYPYKHTIKETKYANGTSLVSIFTEHVGGRYVSAFMFPRCNSVKEAKKIIDKYIKDWHDSQVVSIQEFKYPSTP